MRCIANIICSAQITWKRQTTTHMIFEWRLYFPWLKILFQFIADENRFIDSADFMTEMFGKRKRNLKNAIEPLNEWIRRGGEREGGKEGDVGNTTFPQQMFIFNNKNECQKDNCRVLQGLKREKTQKTLTTYSCLSNTRSSSSSVTRITKKNFLGQLLPSCYHLI